MGVIKLLKKRVEVMYDTLSIENEQCLATQYKHHSNSVAWTMLTDKRMAKVSQPWQPRVF
jgi:hypothetical protein